MTTKFLQSALGKSNHPKYGTLHGNIATDGFRCHRDNSLPTVEDDVTKVIACAGIIPSQPRNRATVSRVDLITACLRALALRDEWDRKNKRYPILTFCMNGSLQYSAKNETIGTTYAEIIDGMKVTDKVKEIKKGLKLKFIGHKMVYRHHNPEKVVTFALNPRQLLDALEGMEGDTVEIDTPASLAPFYMTDGTREAVIMPLNVQ